VQLENNRLSIDNILNVIPNDAKDNVLIFYSNAHLVELNESYHVDENVRKLWISKRLDCIKEVSGNWFLDLNSELNGMDLSKVEPRISFTKLGSDNITNKKIKFYVNRISHENRNKLLKLTGINKGEFNHLDPEEVLEKINDKLTKIGLNSIEEFIGINSNLENPFELSDAVSKIFELLDLFGYCSDKQNEKSNFARTLDSNHCFYAAYADFFITDDKRTLMKSNQAYKFCGLKTKAISIN